MRTRGPWPCIVRRTRHPSGSCSAATGLPLRATSEAGFFEICALDHLSDFGELLSPDPASVSFADIVTAKDELVKALSPSVSAFLLDARYGLQTVATGSLPGTVGLMSTIEDEDYSLPDGPRRTRLRAGWSPEQIKL